MCNNLQALSETSYPDAVHLTTKRREPVHHIEELLAEVLPTPNENAEDFDITNSSEAVALDGIIQAIIKSTLYSMWDFIQLAPYTKFDVMPVLLRNINHYFPTSHSESLAKATDDSVRTLALMGSEQRVDALLGAIADIFQEFNNVLCEKYDEGSDLDDLHLATSITQLLVDCTTVNVEALPSRLADHSINLLSRFQAQGEASDLDRAIAAGRSAVDLTSSGDIDKLVRLSNLSVALKHRFGQHGELPDIDDAITIGQQAAEIAPDCDPNKPSYLRNLAHSFHTKFKRLGNTADINSAVAAMQLAYELTPLDHPAKPSLSSDLGLYLCFRFDRSGRIADIEHAVNATRHAVEIMDDGNPDKVSAHRNLGLALLHRFDRLGSTPDIHEAIDSTRMALSLSSDDDPTVPDCLNTLGNALVSRFQRFYVISDIDEAASTIRRAIDLSSDDDHARARYLSNLGHCLETRFERLGNLSEIEDAIAANREAVATAPDWHLEKAGYLTNLGNSLWARFERLDNRADIDDAVVSLGRAVDLMTDDDPTMSHALCGLGAALECRFNEYKDPLDIENAITSLRRALSTQPREYFDEPAILTTLGQCLLTSYLQLGRDFDIDEAVTSMTRAVECTPESHPDYPFFLRNLGTALRHRLSRSPVESDFMLAYESFEKAAHSSSGAPELKLRAALQNTRLCAAFPDLVPSSDNLLRAHQAVVDSIPSFIWLGQVVSHRFDELLRLKIGDGITAAAAAAIAAGRHALAMEWLEQGRSVLWGQHLALRKPLVDLQKVNPDLADKLKEVSASLDAAGRRYTQAYEQTTEIEAVHASPSGGPFTGIGRSKYASAALEDEARERRQLAIDYEQLLAEVRQVDGFEGFACGRKLSELAPACRDGPVAVINVHESRCDALVLCSDSRIVHVPLPLLSLQVAKDVRKLFTSSIRGRDVRQRGARPPQSSEDIREALKTLWFCVVGPILSKVEGELRAYIDPSYNLPRMTWCATGPLVSLPLHAAGMYHSRGSRIPGAMDLIVSSYTPSLSALLTSHTQQVGLSLSDSIEPKILVVSQPNTPEQAPLPYTVAEATNICNRFPGSVTHFNAEQATVEAVSSAIAQNQWLHLACHGADDPEDWTGSSFFLHDGALNLERLMDLSHPNAELAVLSACRTAKADEDLPEEAVHLSAGMLAVGYRSVIGTMWAITDEDGPTIADALYAELKRDLEAAKTTRAAFALHKAVMKLRDAVGERSFERWVPFVHFGA